MSHFSRSSWSAYNSSQILGQLLDDMAKICENEEQEQKKKQPMDAWTETVVRWLLNSVSVCVPVSSASSMSEARVGLTRIRHDMNWRMRRAAMRVMEHVRGEEQWLRGDERSQTHGTKSSVVRVLRGVVECEDVWRHVMSFV